MHNVNFTNQTLYDTALNLRLVTVREGGFLWRCKHSKLGYYAFKHY